MQAFITLLVIFAEAAGTAFGKQVADRLCDALGIFAKESGEGDIRRAIADLVSEIKNIIDQAVIDLEYADIETNFYVASQLLQDWKDHHGDHSLLTVIRENSFAAIGRFEHLAKNKDPQAWRKYYATLTMIVMTDVAAQSAYVTYVTNDDPESTASLIKRCRDHADRLERCHSQINRYYKETVEFRIGPSGVTTKVGYVWFITVTGQRYPGGRQITEGPAANTKEEARQHMKKTYDMIVARVNKESADRQEFVLTPLLKVIDSLRSGFPLKIEDYSANIARLKK